MTSVAVIRSLLEARGRRDLARLARCESVTAGKERLDADDEARAWRHFGMKSIQPFWTKIEQALERGDARFTEDGDRAKGTFDVGGSLGEIEIEFVEYNGDWYLDSGE